MPEGSERYLATERFEKSSNKFSMKTLTYVDANIAASREETEKGLFKISGSSLTRARNCLCLKTIENLIY